MSNNDYLKSVLTSVSEKLNVLAISVKYCGASRLGGYVTLAFDQWNYDKLCYDLKQLGITQLPALKAILDGDYYSNLGKIYAQALNSGLDPAHPLITLTGHTPGEHFDFGLVQVLDCLWAVGILKQDYRQIAWPKLMAAGISHGGYLAMQCARFAPHTFSKVVNCYGWTTPYLPWLIKDLYGLEQRINDIPIRIFFENYWSLNPSDPNYLSSARTLIRSQEDREQFKQWRSYLDAPTPKFVMIQSIDDEKHPRKTKRAVIEMMQELKFNFAYLEDTEENKERFRTIQQGNNASMKGLLYDFCQPQPDAVQQLNCDFSRKAKIQYHCDDTIYSIDYTAPLPLLQILKKT